jgi:hypothetical protein
VPTVPNEIVIEAMIKGLRPGPSAQYFARKPPQTLEKLLQKMDEYIRADNDFRQRREEAFRFSEMTKGSEEDFIRGMSGQFITPLKAMIEGANSKGHNTLRKLQANSKALLGRQRQGAEEPGASGEDLGTSQEEFTVYSVVKTRAIPPGCAMSPSRSKRR